MQTNHKNNYLTMLPLLLVILIDSMGLGLLFPILNNIIMDPVASFLPVSATLETHNLWYGSLIGIFMLCWFFGAAILGSLSDAIGRKKALLICLFGAFLGYLCSGIAVECHLLFLLFLGRIVAGLTAGSQSIAQAAMVDLSDASERAKYMGFILLASCIGFILGPILGGVLSDHQLIGWFNFSTPLYFSALISLLNVVLLYYLFTETHFSKKEITIKWHDAIAIFVSAFKNKKIRQLSIVFLVMIYGWSNFYTFIAVFASTLHAFSPLKISLLMADMGVGFSIGCGYLANYCANRFSLKNTIIIQLLLSALWVGLLLLTHAEIYLWIGSLLIGITISLAYSLILVLFSNQVSDNEQGWVMGVTGSILALCFGLSGFLTGWLIQYSIHMPLYLSGIGIAISGLLMYGTRVVK